MVREQEIRAFIATLSPEEKSLVIVLAKPNGELATEEAWRRYQAGQPTFWFDSEIRVRTSHALAAWPATATMTPTEIAAFGEGKLLKVPGIGRTSAADIRATLKQVYGLDLAP